VTPSSKVAAAQIAPEGPEGDYVPQGVPRATIDPDTISVDELEHLDQLTGLLDGNPRSLKRFVNTYRLVKTALPDVELEVFRESRTEGNPPGGSEQYSPYRICMAQLVVLCTQRKSALALVRKIDRTKESPRLKEWLAEFQDIDADLVSGFHAALSRDPGVDVNTFKRWLERTRRYSFYV
jgi:hypothetical protein